MFASQSIRSLLPSTGGTAKLPFDLGRINLDNLELKFLRVLGRSKVPIASSDDFQTQTTDDLAGDSSQGGATTEVHKANWKGQKVAIKYVRQSYTGEKYRRAFYDLNFELQLLSKQSLRKHKNIPTLLAVCFIEDSSHTGKSEVEFAPAVRPGLVVELAHEQYPDLRYFFDMGRNPLRPQRLPYSTSASLIADIADGMTALHEHDIVHADLKPENILIYPDAASPGSIVAKVADFGFVGMAIYLNNGLRAPHPDSRPRGGTQEWSAPECLEEPDYWTSNKSLDHPSYEACSDIYSFGLLSCYIALDGQTPIEYAPNLSRDKLSDSLLDKAVARLQHHHANGVLGTEESLLEPALYIAQQTLKLDWRERIKSLRSIRGLLHGSGSDEVYPQTNDKFVVNFNLFPDSAHEFKCHGLYAAYWASPPAFREAVLESFKKHSSGPFGQYVPAEVWACMKEKGGESESGNGD